MQNSQPSLTALLVAAARAVPGPLPAFDPDLGQEIGGPVGKVLTLLATTRAGKLLARTAGMGIVEHVHLRTAAIDHALQEAVAAGVRQVVVLGAGYDHRAWRLEALRLCKVFEVDHPATQQRKRESLQNRPPLCNQLVFAPVDFAAEDLGEKLHDAGHNPQLPTAWLWEGVTMYLPPPAMRATLATVAARSATGSRLVLTYMTPQMVPGGRLARRVAGQAFGVIGEPLLGALEKDQLRQLLDDHGLALRFDTDNADWAKTHGGSAARALLFACERLAVGEKL